MPAVRATPATSATPTAAASHRAGITSAAPDLIHAVETTFAGSVTVCTGSLVSRTLRVPFENAGRATCPECAKRLDSPDSGGKADVVIIL